MAALRDRIEDGNRRCGGWFWGSRRGCRCGRRWLGRRRNLLRRRGCSDFVGIAGARPQGQNDAQDEGDDHGVHGDQDCLDGFVETDSRRNELAQLLEVGEDTLQGVNCRPRNELEDVG